MKKQSNDYVGKVRCIKSETSCFTVGKIYDFPSPTDNEGDKRLGIEILDGGVWSFEPVIEETTKTINYNQAQLIIDAACTMWKERLFTRWGKAIVLKQSIDITEEEYQTMRSVCTEAQHELFDDIFGKDVKFKIGDWVTYWSESEQKTLTSKIVKATASTYCVLENGKEPFYDLLKLATEEEILKAKYKVGDWVYVVDGKSGAKDANGCVGQITDDKSNNGLLSWEEGVNIKIGLKIWKVCPNAELRIATEEEITQANAIPEGTPCLVRDNDDSPWKLAYSNGNGKFDIDACVELPWEQVLVLDMNNLPTYPKKS
jgi:hypothetical protein